MLAVVTRTFFSLKSTVLLWHNSGVHCMSVGYYEWQRHVALKQTDDVSEESTDVTTWIVTFCETFEIFRRNIVT
jgi:hypothetical protein